MTLPTAWCGTSGHQNSEKVNFYWLSHTVCRDLLGWPQETNAGTSRRMDTLSDEAVGGPSHWQPPCASPHSIRSHPH